MSDWNFKNGYHAAVLQWFTPQTVYMFKYAEIT